MNPVHAIRSFLPLSRRREALRFASTQHLLRIPSVLYADMKAHAMEEGPRECCGILATDGCLVERVYRCSNVAERPIDGYFLDPDDQLWVMGQIAEAGYSLGAVYHSHTTAQPMPSCEDIRLAYPGVLHVIMGMGGGFVTRAWDIAGCCVREARVEVV